MTMFVTSSNHIKQPYQATTRVRKSIDFAGTVVLTTRFKEYKL